MPVHTPFECPDVLYILSELNSIIIIIFVGFQVTYFTKPSKFKSEDFNSLLMKFTMR